MGDKSPKSKQKHQNQKQIQTDASNKKKARDIVRKQQANVPPAKKK